ncbi:hypothetical protein MUK42_17054 [Musa troglodytarum]|uniref:Uncharacterized protein n=1 Tax=Musa troglodytarum TaxID=320322 RepID=A0A9E7HM10_9LILI|nr:hypothetical protein MUK42_17054 [Musa troglodytarum]
MRKKERDQSVESTATTAPHMPSIKPDSPTHTSHRLEPFPSLLGLPQTPLSSLPCCFTVDIRNRWRTMARPTASISSWPSSSLHWVSSSSSDARDFRIWCWRNEVVVLSASLCSATDGSSVALMVICTVSGPSIVV